MDKVIKERSDKIDINELNNSNLSNIQKIILSKRLSSLEQFDKVLNPSIKNMENPLNLKDMRKGAERLIKALKNKEKILCVVDYDQDGIASGAILKKGFELLKVDDRYFEVYVTNRHHDGYGFSLGCAKKSLMKNPDVILTADLGSSDGANIDWYLSQENGKHCDFVITDHHHISEKTPPTNAYAFINPQRKDSEYKDKTICGAVVAFNFILAIRMILKENNDSLSDFDIKKIMDFTAPATIADCMDLRSEMNRYYINYGITQMNEGSRTAWRVIYEEFCKNGGKIKTDTIAFQLAPRVNAVSRMGGDGLNALNFLTSENENECKRLFKEITSTNEDRKESQLEGFLKADEEAQKLSRDNFALVILIPEIEHGVAGIVASKIVEKYGRPTIILGKNKDFLFTGSGRSIEGFDLRKAVVNTQERHKTLLKFGGHEAAIGLSMNSEDLDTFRKDLNIEVEKEYKRLDNLKPIIYFDYIFNNSSEITQELYDSLNKLEPYGQNFQRPSFAIRAKIVHLEWTNKGQGNHMKLIMTDLENEQLPVAMWFNAASYIDKLNQEDISLIGEIKTVVFELMESNFRNKKEIQLMISHIDKN